MRYAETPSLEAQHTELQRQTKRRRSQHVGHRLTSSLSFLSEAMMVFKNLAERLRVCALSWDEN
jgi:hypothetical protein